MMNVEAIQGRAERRRRRQERRERRQERREERKERRQERRAEGRAWWQKLGRAAKKVSPPLVAARAAVLALVSNNVGGLASKMANAQPQRAKAKWVKMGGEWDKLADAIEKGSGKRPTVNAVPLLALAPVLQEIGKGATVAAAKKAGAQAVAEGKSEGAGGLWKVAQVILEPLLRLLGIGREEVAPPGAPPPLTTKELDEIDAADEPGAAGGEGASNTALLVAGAAVVAFVVLSPKK
jgi:hypothetical protein